MFNSPQSFGVCNNLFDLKPEFSQISLIFRKMKFKQNFHLLLAAVILLSDIYAISKLCYCIYFHPENCTELQVSFASFQNLFRSSKGEKTSNGNGYQWFLWWHILQVIIATLSQAWNRTNYSDRQKGILGFRTGSLL